MVDLIPAKCPHCGANLQLPNNVEKAYCTHCGTNFIVGVKNESRILHQQEVSFCSHCGKGLNVQAGTQVYKCVICNSKLCEDCIHELSGRYYCGDCIIKSSNGGVVDGRLSKNREQKRQEDEAARKKKTRQLFLLFLIAMICMMLALLM